jgi:hypothetical protein
MPAHKFTKAELFYLESNLEKPLEDIAKDIGCHVRTVKRKVAALKRSRKKAEKEVAATPVVVEAAPTPAPAPAPAQNAFVTHKSGMVAYTGTQSLIDDGDGQGNRGNAPRQPNPDNAEFLAKYGKNIHRTGSNLPTPAQ